MYTLTGRRPKSQAFARTSRILRVLIDRLDVYRRYIQAGSEVEALLSLSDRQLAERGLTRGAIGRTVLEKHGLGLGPSPASNCGPTCPDA